MNTTRTRCGNGTRKCINGKCMTKSAIKSSSSKPRCKRGTRRCANNICYGKTNQTNSSENRKMKELSTPRTKYARQYHKHKIMMRGNSKLFQVNFDKKQFTKYVNLSDKPRVDCVFQSLFALGLRSCEMSKTSSLQCNKYGQSGVEHKEVIKYIIDIFNLKKQNIEYVAYENSYVDTIDGYFNTNLADNHATLFNIFFSKKGVFTYGHAIIAYKYNNRVYYFDPQSKNKKMVSMTLDIRDFLDETDNDEIMEFGIYRITGVKESKEMKPMDQCLTQIKYVG